MVISAPLGGGPGVATATLRSPQPRMTVSSTTTSSVPRAARYLATDRDIRTAGSAAGSASGILSGTPT